jgi:predicted lipoprotein with Yx(FWY)xxD motif
MKALVTVLAVAALAAAPAFAVEMAPVTKVKTKQFGVVLATPKHLALYTWDSERDKKVHCVGSCAKAWPPLLVAKGAMVHKHIAGIMGAFGQAMRPNGTHQLTFNGRPLYTYHGDTRTKILCDGVDGWHVVRLAH